jgi:IS30 family transposase
VLPRDELRKTLIGEFHKSRRERVSRARGTDRRVTIPNVRSIRERQIAACGPAVSGHREADLAKRARNVGAVSSLVEHDSRYLILADLTDASAVANLHAVTRRCRRVPRQLSTTLIYDQERDGAS